MDFQIVKLPDHPVIVFQPTDRFKLKEALPVMINQVTTVLDALTERVFYIADMRQARINLDDLLLSMTTVIFGDKPFLRHPNIREVLLVTTNPLIRKVAGGLASGMYGDVALQVMFNYEDALAYAIQASADGATKPPSGM
jgi:hypothetical protein